MKFFEPQAAAMRAMVEENKWVLVLDLGGGTFDIALIKQVGVDDGATITTAANGGDPDFGGLDPVALTRLAEAVQVHLSEAEEVVVDEAFLNSSMGSAAPPRDTITPLTVISRTQVAAGPWKSLIEAFVEKTKLSVTEMMESAGFAPAGSDWSSTLPKFQKKVSSVVLAGGGANLFPLAPAIHTLLGRQPTVPPQPHQAIAAGAAMAAASSVVRGLEVVSTGMGGVVPHNIGIEVTHTIDHGRGTESREGRSSELNMDRTPGA
eukprot:XP_001703815.1 predicted protein [Chlamydomonas reinhardtii]